MIIFVLYPIGSISGHFFLFVISSSFHPCMSTITLKTLYKQALNLILHSLNLTLQLTTLISSNTAANDRPRNTASTTQGNLRWNKHIRNILVFTKEGQMQQNFKRHSVSSHYDQLADSAVQCLCRLICTWARKKSEGGKQRVREVGGESTWCVGTILNLKRGGDRGHHGDAHPHCLQTRTHPS